MADVKVKATQIIPPASPTFNGVLPLTEFERVVSFGSYIPWVYFYKSPANESPAHDESPSIISSKLRDSLARTLVHFYPFTGRLVFHQNSPNDHRGLVELRCTGGSERDDETSGAVFIEAESSSEIADFGNFSNFYQFEHIIPSVDKLYDRSPKEMEKVPLLLVQLTFFRCGGFTIGISMSHSVVDGLSASHFIREWARITRGELLETPPFLDRTILTATATSDPPKKTLDSGIGDNCLPNMQEDSSIKNHVEETPKFDFKMLETKTTMLMLPLTEDQVEQLKNTAAIKHNDHGNPPPRPYSRYEVITAHIWRCLCKAKGYDSHSSTLTALGVIVDIRTRVKPSLPTAFFGSGVLMVAASARAGEIILNPLSFACSKLRHTINCITHDYIRSDIEKLQSLRLDDTPKGEGEDGGFMIPTADGTKVSLDLSVTSWLRLPLRGMDFGWGDEVSMRSGLTNFEGVTAIMPEKGSGDGGINVVVCFQSVHMDGFVKYFYGDIVA